MFQGIHSVMFHVQNVENACEWYSQLLSIEPFYRLENFPVLRIGNSEICFHKSDSKVSSGKFGSVTYWRVENFGKAVARAEEMGGIVHRGPLKIENGNTICQILDPFGNLFGLVGPEIR